MRTSEIVRSLMSMSERSNSADVCLTHQMLVQMAKDVKADEDDYKRMESEVVEKSVALCRYGSEIVYLRHLASDMYKQLLNAYDPKEIEEFADDLREHGVVID